MLVRSHSDVECRLGHNARLYRCVKMYFRRFRYSFCHMSRWSISQARMTSPRVFVAARQQMPMGRRQRNHPFARRAAFLKTTTELLPELTCKVEHRIILRGSRFGELINGRHMWPYLISSSVLIFIKRRLRSIKSISAFARIICSPFLLYFLISNAIPKFVIKLNDIIRMHV